MAIIAEKLSIANYNKLDNIPVINQDLSVSGFTPTANTYYRHTGSTTSTFTQGVIYLYDTAYHKLGESGGGTTLNRYQLYLYVSSLQSKSLLLYKIYTQAKGRVSICEYLYNNSSDFNYTEYTPYFISNSSIRLFCISGQQGSMYIQALSSESGTRKRDYATIESNKTISNAGSTSWDGQIKIIYYNDTEITE